MKKLFSILCALVLLGACTKFEEGINVNPTLPSEASGTQLIANAMLSLPDLSSSPYGEFLGQYLAETQYVTNSLYPVQSRSFYGWYQSPLKNLQTVIDAEELSTADGPVANQKAVAMILKSYFYWNITDRWGDVPYSEALNGVENFKPIYDTQESIYNNLFQTLKDANAMIVDGGITNDIVYGGDMDKWKKLGNTIRLLMALRISEVNPELGAQEFNAALADGIMTSNDDNLVFKHLADANNQNYWYSQVVVRNREWWALTTNLVEDMKPVDDPRLSVYGSPTRETGEFIGMPFGETEALGTEQYSLLGETIFAQDAPIYLVTYPQALFAIAEAANRGWVAEDPETYYNLAIENSVLQWTGSTDGVAEFLNQPGIAFNASGNVLEQISKQRWIHLFMNGYEAWTEWRRTGYPADFVEPQGNPIPTRLAYPDNETFLNAANHDEAVQRQFGGEDTMFGHVWWDVN